MRKYFKITILPFFVLLLISCEQRIKFKADKLNEENYEIYKGKIIFSGNDTTLENYYSRLADSINCIDSSYHITKDTYLSSYVKTDVNDFFKKDGIVPDEKTAAEISYIYLKNLYGEQRIKKELPLIVYTVDDYWLVKGTFPMTGVEKGGVAELLICKRDGKVIHVTHGK